MQGEPPSHHRLTQQCFPTSRSAKETQGGSGGSKQLPWAGDVLCRLPLWGRLLGKGDILHPCYCGANQEAFTNTFDLCPKSTFSKSMVSFIFSGLVAFRVTKAYHR